MMHGLMKCVSKLLTVTQMMQGYAELAILICSNEKHFQMKLQNETKKNVLVK